MKSKAPLSLKLILFVCVVLLIAVGTSLGAPKKDTLTVTALTASDGIDPTLKGNSANSPKEWWYLLCTPLDAAVNITIPLTYQIDNTSLVAGDSYQVTAHATGQLSSYVSDVTTTVLDDSSVVPVNVVISGAAVAAGDYHLNVQISATPASGVNIVHATIHIVISANAACTKTLTAKCMLTSSDYIPLQDCSGNFITDSTGGTFPIVLNNKGTIVSTNPGQFYYNETWLNDTGADKTVTFNLVAYADLINSGAQSVHAMTFDPSCISQNTEADLFFDTNTNGTPCGPYAAGGCSVLVPAGYTLWVTWHSQFSLIGTNGKWISNSCQATSDATHPQISAEGLLTWDGGTYDCTASAVGYAKK